MPDKPPAPPLSKAQAPCPRRFSWRMRLFLGVMLFFIVYRPLCILFPWNTWADQLEMQTWPRRLPTRAERAKLAAQASEERPFPVTDRVLESFDSLWRFFKPWPSADTRKDIRAPRDYASFAFCWINSRAEFFEHLAAFHTKWWMFSPSTAKQTYILRARLLFADGSSRIEHGRTGPHDITHYFRWFEVRLLNYEYKIDESGRSACAGFCNLLAHRYPSNEAGAELKTIRLFTARFDLPQPGTDARAAWEAQQGPPDKKPYPDFFEYDVASRNGKFLKK